MLINLAISAMNLIGGILLAAFILWDGAKIQETLSAFDRAVSQAGLVALGSERAPKALLRVRTAVFLTIQALAVLAIAGSFFSWEDASPALRTLRTATEMLAYGWALLALTVTASALVAVKIIRFCNTGQRSERNITRIGAALLLAAFVADNYSALLSSP